MMNYELRIMNESKIRRMKYAGLFRKVTAIY